MVKPAGAKGGARTVVVSPASKGKLGKDTGFPSIGIGASAGGLEAFELFFRNMPPDSGMAFVLVSPLDPGHASLLSEILQRSTAMPVVEALDQIEVAPDHVYVIPPNRTCPSFTAPFISASPKLSAGSGQARRNIAYCL